jgi:hypothetical protein
MKANTERRLNARLPHSSSLKVKDVAKGRFQRGMTINYSKDGLFFETDTYFEPGTEIFIAIEDTPFDDPVDCGGPQNLDSVLSSDLDPEGRIRDEQETQKAQCPIQG